MREYGARSIPGGGAINAIEIDARCERLLKITWSRLIEEKPNAASEGSVFIGWTHEIPGKVSGSVLRD